MKREMRRGVDAAGGGDKGCEWSGWQGEGVWMKGEMRRGVDAAGGRRGGEGGRSRVDPGD